jgi:hypothetical protein
MNSVKLDGSRSALWASAFVIGALILVQAGRLQPNPAYAEMASQREGYTLLTCSMGRGPDEDPDEFLYVLDSRNQALMVYEIVDARRRQIDLRDSRSIEQMFSALRQ